MHISVSSSYTRNYNYDAASNKLLKTQVGSNTYSYGYDAMGNMNVFPHLSAGMTYNSNNYMSAANLGGGGNVYYQYDSSGQRSRKTVINSSGNTQRIYFGNYEIYRVYNSSGTLTLERRTVHIADDTGRIAMYEYRTAGSDSYAATLSRYICSNHLGTSSVELDPTGAVISYEEYHPYGTTAFQENNTAINAVAKRYRFTGKERDDESGFYYIGARYYAPWLGRWCACDPLESKYSPQSPYCYCSDNPIGRVDPTGKGDKIAGAWDPVRTEDTPTRPATDVIMETGEKQKPVSPDSPISGGVDISTKKKSHHVHSQKHHKTNIGVEMVGAISAIDKDINAFRASQAKKDAAPTTAQIGSQVIDLSTGLVVGHASAQAKAAAKPDSVFRIENGIVNSDKVTVKIIEKVEQDKFNHAIKGIVLHQTDGSTAAGALNYWNSAANDVPVGAHFLIDKNGTIYQTASLDYSTNHTKSEKLKTIRNHNAIGVEFVGIPDKGTDIYEAPTEEQKQSGIWLVNNLLKNYNLTQSDVYYHGEIAKKNPTEGQKIYNTILPFLIR